MYDILVQDDTNKNQLSIQITLKLFYTCTLTILNSQLAYDICNTATITNLLQGYRYRYTQPIFNVSSATLQQSKVQAILYRAIIQSHVCKTAIVKKNTVGFYPANACHLQHCNNKKKNYRTIYIYDQPKFASSTTPQQSKLYRLQGYVY